jgi:peptide/nickel transport system substrate-binding protein
MTPRSVLRRALGLSLLLSGCAGADDQRPDPALVPESERYGGTAVVELPADMSTLNPLVLQDAIASGVAQFQLFTPLLRYDSTLQVQPRLAERWDTVRVGRDSLDVTFHLRSDVKWHDGVPTTAGDVLFAFRRMMDPKTAYPSVNMLRGYSRRAEVLNDSTIRFRLRPFPEFLEVWTSVGGLPEHLLKEIPPERLSQAGYGLRPVGNGPFRFAARVPGQSWTLAANPDYPKALGGRPYLDRIVYRVVPEATARLTNLATGAADLIRVTSPQARQVAGTPGVRLVSYQPPAWLYLSWNTRRPLFSDVRVRQALTRAIDRREIVRGVADGYGVEGRTPVTPVHWSYDAADSATTLAYDPEEAKRLLDAAGWRDRDGSGVRSNAAGVPFRFVLKCSNGSDPYCDIAQAVQGHLRRVGLDAQVRQEEYQTLLAELSRRAPDAAGRDYEATVIGFTDSFGKNDESYFGSASQNDPFAETGYHSPVLDSLFDAMDHTPGHDAARPLWRRYQEEMARAQPVTVLYYPQALVGLGPRLQGVKMDARSMLVSSARWWIPPRMRS